MTPPYDPLNPDGRTRDSDESKGHGESGPSEKGRHRPDAPFVIWLDADAAPRPVREMVFRAAQRLDLPAVLVANHRLSLPPGNSLVTQVLVSPGDDVADRHIARHSRQGDLAITADIPLAAELVEHGVHVLDPGGERYTAENVGERLSIRDFMASLRDSGVETGGPSAYGPGRRKAFGDALDRTLTELLR